MICQNLGSDPNLEIIDVSLQHVRVARSAKSSNSEVQNTPDFTTGLILNLTPDLTPNLNYNLTAGLTPACEQETTAVRPKIARWAHSSKLTYY
jgi:hypothetical protein